MGCLTVIYLPNRPNRSRPGGVYEGVESVGVERGGVERVVRDRADARADFVVLVEPCWSDMARFARGVAPAGRWEDVLQEALSSAWRKWSLFDEQRGTVRNWLLAIVADQARKESRRLRPQSELIDDISVVAGGPGVESDLDLWRALSQLSRRQRAAICLHYYLGLPLAEIADVMGCRVGTVKSTLSDGRARLRHELGEDYRDA